MMNYPNPCNACVNGDACKTSNMCKKYQTWVNTWWSYFKGMFQQAGGCEKTKENKFTYAHPDDIRRSLRKSPCDGCKIAEYCDTPCQVYLRWYDARMEIVRKKVGL